jgi:hypothetical protein
MADLDAEPPPRALRAATVTRLSTLLACAIIDTTIRSLVLAESAAQTIRAMGDKWSRLRQHSCATLRPGRKVLQRMGEK